LSGLTLLALLASALLGVSDFLGGTVSRRVPLPVVLLLSQIVATVAVSSRLLAEPFDPGAAGALFWGALGGIATAVAVAALFRGLAIGTMGVVAPITSLSVLVPVAVGILTGDPLSWTLAAGILVAIVGTVLASGPEVRSGTRSGDARRPQSVVLAVVAALGFGFANLSVALGSVSSVTTTLVTNTLSVLACYAVAFAVWWGLRRRDGSAGPDAAPRTLPRIAARDYAAIAAIGVLGFVANLCFALASLDGALSVVALLASLFPVVTVLLGWRILGEHLQRVQVIGIVAVFVGVGAFAVTG
jgi:drug/metabolite transporter (DMT)-like permease